MITDRLPMPTRRVPSRAAATMIWASWPVGFLLIMAHTLGGLLNRPTFILCAAGLAIALGLALRATGGSSVLRDDGGCWCWPVR